MKNALQSQLLKAGLVDKKKVKKINKQTAHAKRTGDDSLNEAKKSVAQAKAEKLEKDQKLNQEMQQELELKSLKSNIAQMIKQHQIEETAGDVEYKFADGTTIKKLYVSQKFYEQIVAGHLVIARMEIIDGDNECDYALLPHPLAERIDNKMSGFIINIAKEDTTPDEDDPYAAYVIPDDLMW